MNGAVSDIPDYIWADKDKKEYTVLLTRGIPSEAEIEQKRIESAMSKAELLKLKKKKLAALKLKKEEEALAKK